MKKLIVAFAVLVGGLVAEAKALDIQLQSPGNLKVFIAPIPSTLPTVQTTVFMDTNPITPPQEQYFTTKYQNSPLRIKVYDAATGAALCNGDFNGAAFLKISFDGSKWVIAR